MIHTATLQRTSRAIAVLILATWTAAGALAEETPSADDSPDRVSYYEHIRPIFQANCQGCHQPARANGEYVMTSFDALLKGGESETPAIVPGEPAESYLLDLVEVIGGVAEMPKGKKPLAEAEVALIRRWIEQGAVDDTPENARQRYDMDHPPVYTRPPVVTSLDCAPDGKTLAVAGFHEVLLLNAQTGQRLARLVGMSERIESVRFSPDGKLLAVTGGLPARMGELQIWNVEKRRLTQSVPVTYDTVYGGSWSPDGKLISLGCADNSVRAFEVDSGKQVVYMAAHEDWVRDTVFSADGKSIFSVSRDKTVKQTDVATERFIGNVTTHTPGILRGGQICVARHPKRNELLVGGADGAPKLFKMDTKAAPNKGGNPNQIREYPAMSGRVFAVDFRPDGAWAFAAASLDGRGQIRAYEVDSGKQLWHVDIPESSIYALSVSPDGKRVAAAGADGRVRVLNAETGSVEATYLPVDVQQDASMDSRTLAVADPETVPEGSESLPDGFEVAQLEATPAKIEISLPTDYAQVVAVATSTSGDTVDVTRMANWRVEGGIGDISPRGLFTPAGDGSGTLIGEVAGQRVEIPVTIAGLGTPYTPDFIRDVMPVISKLGCNAGTCHGAADGKNGFKLSLRGYDPIEDVRGFTDDLASRRTNVAAPDQSLMLLKCTASVPHEGGQVTKAGSKYYRLIREWIGAGAKLDLDVPRVKSIEVLPAKPVVGQAGSRQQMRVLATYTDGSVRDVTREAHISSGDTEVAEADELGLVTALRRGETPVLARYEGAYAATTLTVMGDRSGFVWEEPQTWSRIDELAAAKWKRMKIQPSPLAGDAEFLRRVHLDLTGLPPTAEEVEAFLADDRPTRTKRNEVIDKLIGSEPFVEYWTNKWADLLQVNSKFLGREGARQFRDWIRGEVAANTPYDEFTRKIVTASGSNRENPAASYYKILREAPDTMENTTQLFLGVRFNCNKCHDHPFERWTQDQYYQTAAYFARVGLKKDPESGNKKIGGTAVEGAKPLYEVVFDKSDGEIKHDRTNKITPPQFPYECDYEASQDATRREQLAAWLTSPDNQYFARSYVNRLWGYLMGRGIIEPIDDIRASNPPTNPELLDYLTQEFVDSGFDVRHVMRLITQSRTYQLSIATNRWNEDDTLNYSHATARRLPAEVLYDTIYKAVGSTPRIPGVPPGTRAAALPDAGIGLPDDFLTNLGRPARESACECERSSELQLGPVMALVSGPTVSKAISDPNNALAKLASSEMDDAALVNQLFLRILNRPATEKEIETGVELMQQLPKDHDALVAELAAYEEKLRPEMEKAEAQRQARIAEAKQALQAYEQQIAEREAKLDREHEERIAQAQAALEAYQEQLPAKLTEWEQRVKTGSTWTTIEPIEMSASNNAKLAREDDGAIFVTGPEGKGTYTVVAKVSGPLTGIRLEALADDRLPSKGPGRPQNGNYVVTEFRAAWAAEDKPDEQKPVALQNAQADFSQQSYDVKTAIDGNRNAASGNGWAVSPRLGKNHTAVFETKEDVAAGLLTIHLDQNYQDGKHALGRFRLSVTSSPRPVRLDGLPENIGKILAVAPDKRSDKQKAELLKYYRTVDAELQKLQKQLADAKKPRPVDPKLKALRDKLAEVSQPLPVDPHLAQLRRDVELSRKQLENARLTAAQDLAWALINNPAFLFNR